MVSGIILLISLVFGLVAKLDAVLALEPVPVFQCPVGFTWDCGTCLKVTLPDATWNVARDNCIDLGANLVTIRNADQNRCITKYTSAGTFWMRLYSPATATPPNWQWRWINPMSAAQPVDFQNFGPAPAPITVTCSRGNLTVPKVDIEEDELLTGRAEFIGDQSGKCRHVGFLLHHWVVAEAKTLQRWERSIRDSNNAHVTCRANGIIELSDREPDSAEILGLTVETAFTPKCRDFFYKFVGQLLAV
ncbi:hypothetical protein BV898_03366 [Hypsibius exemplaris]|uniref:C-type lectin domain-containing protein n=1 Tax=Hypsibius exemplaris TaxID=2072580 RepID=A0A1W0X5C2_HYPEX|nr:hypothetical protein BV898_03366 [Hypsibius exemplaris]